jgi:hypothetical protein
MPSLDNAKIQLVMQSDQNGAGLGLDGRLSTATFLQASSGNVANASAAATLTGATNETIYLEGFMWTGAGATAAANVSGTITGLSGGTITFTVTFPAGATVVATPIYIAFPRPIPASATNTSVVVTVPAGGAGNTHSTVTAWGFRK